ncbi:DUF1624 domain-containing protein [Methylobacterium aquaticum]|uniref:DUF1624 domain-containing protein n=1 Tax=Methylobacterium aquaticum TaxID=270351 RepID=UPI001934275F|nr:heparan-alpha-glucosaminide N-acetyltransferase [Methylobacterium aquaticum]QRE78026.1 DUF1624 domain-containing protein [Methylobacterium aquaticum]
MPSAPPPPAVPVRRLAVIDLARGVALLSMALYHLTWDLGFLRLTPENAALSPIGRAAAHGIAGSFLVLVGVSLVLARGRTSQVRSGTGFRSALATIPRSGWQFSRLAFGLVRPEGRHAGWWSAYIARLGRIALAAAVISLATFFLFPDSWIFFGILHCIALSSVLALPALVAPLPLVGLAAALVFAGPTLVGLAGAPAVLDAPGLFFLGLGATVPTTNDYVPLFPWFGFVLAGVALGRLGLPRLAASALGRWAPRDPVGRLATGAGRHSLAVYLVHQPLLLGLLYGVAAVTGPHPRAGQAQFLREYRDNCAEAGGTEAACRVAARCVLVRLRDEGLWRAGGDFTDQEQARAIAVSRTCFREAGGG